MIKKANNKKIAIVDYGVGNLYSLKKAFENFGDNVSITEAMDEIACADAIVLPGVGSFQAGIEGLAVRNLIPGIQKYALQGKPILGICLGAQLLLSYGYEFGKFKGLDIIPGNVIKLPEPVAEKIPHIGWNAIKPATPSQWQTTILDSIKPDSDLYFVHSYILQPQKKEHILALTNYDTTSFCSVMRKGNTYGCQFHPEKSASVGLKIIENFINLI